MRIFFGILGGLMALALYFFMWLRALTHGLPKGVTVGISASLLVRPVYLVWEILSFAVGFTVVYMLARPRA